ncbi:hypothetical protein [uncultured Sphingomonas sp.]|uniref:hypothetical protein n=1 Tax=uncultured Sphingomonas sp. TaxID=158754 RepID=UPI002618CE94|nr:hypothetical protein [uncultured Sphingomonas sp.]
MTQQDTQPPAETRDRLTHDEQMQDAQKGCAPCALCGGHAIISDAGSGAGYFIRCSNSQIFKASEGCMIEQRRLGGWAYNVMDWWNRLHTAALTRRAGGDEGAQCGWCRDFPDSDRCDCVALALPAPVGEGAFTVENTAGDFVASFSTRLLADFFVSEGSGCYRHRNAHPGSDA